MRLKVSIASERKHTDFVTCVDWNTTEEVYSCGDDHTILKWNLINNESIKIVDLPNTLYPTDMHWFNRGQGVGRKPGADFLLLTSADGKFHLVGKNGRFEKSVEAHKGAALVGRWSYDGAGFLTGGEDGQVKIWSRGGMLRSTVIQTGPPVYSAAWSGDSNQVLIAQGKMLVVKSLAPNSKPTRWNAHEGLILKVAWNINNNLIVSGGEDCRYKVWDPHGQQLYCSASHDYPITSIAWSTNGSVFAVGSFNTLRLCDKTGWSHSLEKPNTGSIYSLAWSNDSTQLAGACANGHVIFAHVIERRIEWGSFEATLTGRRSIELKDVINDSQEHFEFPDRVLHLALAYNHLLVVTASQCHVYSSQHWNTPTILELREGSVCMTLLAAKNFMLVEKSSVNVYSYEGRLLCSPRWPSMQPELLNESCISLSPGVIAVRDQNDDKGNWCWQQCSKSRGEQLRAVASAILTAPCEIHCIATNTNFQGRKAAPETNSSSCLLRLITWWGSYDVIHVFEMGSSKSLTAAPPMLHTMGILKIALSQATNAADRLLALVDKNQDLYLASNLTGTNRKFGKLGRMVQSLCWNTELNMLAAIQDTVLAVWYHPAVVLTDRRLLQRTMATQDSSDFGKNPTVVSFVGNHVGVRRVDGSLLISAVPVYISILHERAAAKRWEDALKLCRIVKEDRLWACLAVMAASAQELNTAEEAYAAINELDKVIYLQHIKDIPGRAERTAEIMLMMGGVEEAENTLLRNGLPLKAIMVNIHTHNWNRALTFAEKHQTDIDVVLYLRKQHLESLGKPETNEKFLAYKNEVLNEAEIKKKIDQAYAQGKG